MPVIRRRRSPPGAYQGTCAHRHTRYIQIQAHKYTCNAAAHVAASHQNTETRSPETHRGTTQASLTTHVHSCPYAMKSSFVYSTRTRGRSSRHWPLSPRPPDPAAGRPPGNLMRSGYAGGPELGPTRLREAFPHALRLCPLQSRPTEAVQAPRVPLIIITPSPPPHTGQPASLPLLLPFRVRVRNTLAGTAFQSFVFFHLSIFSFLLGP